MISPAECLTELRKRKYHLPFQPFEVETIEGGRYQVGRRMGFAATERTLVVLDRMDHSHRVPLSKVKSIKTILAKTH